MYDFINFILTNIYVINPKNYRVTVQSLNIHVCLHKIMDQSFNSLGIRISDHNVEVLCSQGRNGHGVYEYYQYGRICI